MIDEAEHVENSLEEVAGEGEVAGRRKVIIVTEGSSAAAGVLLGRRRLRVVEGGCAGEARVHWCAQCTK